MEGPEKTRTYEDQPNFKDLNKNARRFLSGKRNPLLVTSILFSFWSCLINCISAAIAKDKTGLDLFQDCWNKKSITTNVCMYANLVNFEVYLKVPLKSNFDQATQKNKKSYLIWQN